MKRRKTDNQSLILSILFACVCMFIATLASNADELEVAPDRVIQDTGFAHTD